MAELKTFLFTDISGSVRLKNEMAGRDVTERDRAFIDTILTPHRERIEAQLHEMGGRVVSTAGDGHFLVFDNTIQAALWAVAMQRSHRDEPIATPGGKPVEVRVSVHAGVPQVDPSDPDNFIGKSVDYASRLNDYATGGQILVSRSVMAILDDVGLEGLRLHYHGRRSLKGIGDVDVHELLYDDSSPRPMRTQPKEHAERQWTVVPTLGFDVGSTGANRVAAPPGTALRRVGNYELEEQLGSGGMGDVYKARHVQFGRVRAVKVIKPQFVESGHSEVIRRFYNEIKAVGRLEHKNIVVAIDSSSPTDKVHYLVMEYIDGVSVDELVARHGPLPVPDACEIIRQAARGLQYIHKNDMVHRDIKPSNLMITVVDGEVQSDSTLTQQGADGQQRAIVKILDLGLALLAVDRHDRLTRFDHKAMGTGMYMPPEQWKTTSVDIRADIYSLGCTLYHLLAGNPPFYDSDLRPEKAHEKSAPPMIRSSVQPLPKKLWDVLRKMLEKRPEDRYATPAEVAAALTPFAEGQHLAALVTAHETGVGTSSALRETVADGTAPVDTRRSRPWFSGLDQPTRRWLLGTALPLGLIAMFGGGALYVLNESSKSALEKFARESLPSVAKHAARDTLPGELANRFKALGEMAQEPKLLDALVKLNEEIPSGAPPLEALDPAAMDELDVWIATLEHRFGEQIDVDSWFVNNVHGIQVARSPKDDSIGQSYRHRDYFHGQATYITETDSRLSEVKPIEQNHLSQVYRSSTSGLLKVAFSVPIRQPATSAQGQPQEPKVIGVLAMSVNVHEFKVLDDELAGGSEIVLVDLRSDWIDRNQDNVPVENRGLILHHPKLKLEKGKLARIDKQLLAQIDAARPLTDQDFDSKDHFLAGVRDPLSPDANVRYWVAFEPVRYDVGDVSAATGPTDRVGWVVLAQRKIE
jgi:serine/threonine protein kinase/class 3 adenylate cyclase